MERFYSFPAYCRKTFGHKLYRIPLDGGFTCPNRDGTLGSLGCIFCDAGGSGDFSTRYIGQRLNPMLLNFIHHPDSPPGSFIGYFQAYTSTYGPIEKLSRLYRCALDDPMLAGISIATRPDCLEDDVIDLLIQLKKEYPNKFIWVELGLQTIHETSAEYIRRGYPLSVFDRAAADLKKAEIPIIVHVIIGLPKESEEMMYETIEYLDQTGIDGIKLQLLHILKGTDLCRLYEQGAVSVLEKEEYIRIISGCIARLSPSIVIHRLTGDGPKDLLVAPKWSLEKRQVLNEISHALKVNNITQGCLLRGNE